MPQIRITLEVSYQTMVFWTITSHFNVIKKALKIKESVFGDKNHPSLAITYNNIGACLYHKHEYDLSLTELTKSLNIRKIALGDEHPETKNTAGWTYGVKCTLENVR